VGDDDGEGGDKETEACGIDASSNVEDGNDDPSNADEVNILGECWCKSGEDDGAGLKLVSLEVARTMFTLLTPVSSLA
jgi:hypothetical protein